MRKLSVFIIFAVIGFCCSLSRDINHPSLIFTPQRVSKASEKIVKDSTYAIAWKAIKSLAEESLESKDINKLDVLSLAYQMTGETKYRDKIITLLVSMIDRPHVDEEMILRKPQWRSELKMANSAYKAALGFDAVYNDLSKGQRIEIAQGLWDAICEPLLGDWLLEPSRIHSLNSMGHNWWTACLGMGGVLAISISNEVPKAAKSAKLAVESLPEWFDFAGDMVHNKAKTFDRDGGMYESINYANFGITEALILRLAWINSHPREALEEIPQIAQIPDFFCNASYPRTGDLYSYGFGDSHINRTGEKPMILAWALGCENPHTLWYINQLADGQNPEGMTINDPLGFLYMPDSTLAPSIPNLPLQHLWTDFGWATLRNSWDKDATMLAVKSGMTWNHAHADANSIILYHKGVDIIKDAGNCSYGKPEYRNYFFQSDAHNVVKFNGHGQSCYQQYHGSLLSGRLGGLTANDNIKYLMADGTGPMADNFARNHRHYLWIDDVILVIDDLKSHDVGEFEWLWHPGGNTIKDRGDLVVTKDSSSVVIRPIYPQPLAPSGFVHDYPEMLYWDILQGPTGDLKGFEEYYSLKLPGKHDRIKGVTALILKDTPGQKKLPKIEQRQGTDWIGVRITSLDGKVTDVYINQLADGRLMHNNSWINADGYETDAYMLVKSQETTFVVHGSALRKDDKSIFSSLSKLNFLAQEKGNSLDIQINGQPRINASYMPQRQASVIKVNGEKANLRMNDNRYQIKLYNQKH
ncbi:MAG: heparinase II/III-family protein [Bacteroidaceae bacterium]|nr:heparinase II/III-family protein [Bacteroidaceae bacterium]